MMLRPRSNRLAKSCTECRRRKQKCIPSKDGPCHNCARRYPPVDCIGRSSFRGRVEASDPEPRSHATSKPRLKVMEERHHYSTTSNSRNIKDPSSISLSRRGRSPYGDPKTFGGVLTAVNAAGVCSVDPTSHNTELYSFYHKAVAPLMASLDGQNTPSVFQTAVLPWMMQSPIMPKLAILTASGYRALIRGVEVTKCPETLALKGDLMSDINEFLNQDFNQIYNQAIQCVAHLTLLEWYWGDHSYLWAHLNGLRGMIKLRGSSRGLQSAFLRQLLTHTDFAISCCLEQDLYLLRLEESFDFPAPICYPESYNSPLFSSKTDFKPTCESLGLSLSIPSILDNMRFITTSVVSLSISGNGPLTFTQNETSKVLRRNTLRIHNDTKSLPIIPITAISSINDTIYEAIRITAIAYTSGIAFRIPFSSCYDEGVRQELYHRVWRVSLSIWKKIPGILLWILLTACPGSKNDAQGRMLRRNASVTSLYISFQDIGLSVACLRRFWIVQRWIANAGLKTDEEEGTA